MPSIPAAPTKKKRRAPVQGLPGHWQRGRRQAMLAMLLLVAGSTFLLRDLGRADRIDGWWLSARFTLREQYRPTPPDRDIVLIAIDDASLKKWKEPFVFWGPHLAKAIERVSQGGASVVALDWLQPIRSEEWFADKYQALKPIFAKNDEQLSMALSRTRSAVMIRTLIPAQGTQPARWNDPNIEILYSLPNGVPDPARNLGYAEFNEKESIVTSIAPVVPGEETVKSFAARIAEHFSNADSLVKDETWQLTRPKAELSAVPLRHDGSVLVNYHVPAATSAAGTSKAFTTYSLAEIATPSARPDLRFKGKIVIIGATFAVSNDEHYVPVLTGLKTRSLPGMEIHGHFVRTLLDGNPIDEPAPLELWMLAIVPGLCGILAFGRLHWVPAALVGLLVAASWVALSLALFVFRDFALPAAVPLIGLALGGGGMGAYRAFGEERERQQVLGLWGRYQDPRQVAYLLQHPEARGGQGQEAPVTVLFADLKNFTKTVEHLAPGEALQVLNRYLALMTDVIRDEYGGFVDKYLGDGLMAQWGAPAPWEPAQPGEDHATTAVRACLELERRTRELTQSIAGDRDVTFGLRLTLHTGPVVVGWVGASRLEFTIIGDTVNVTSRLQETAKELNCEFLISETTYESVADWVKTGQQAEVVIRGREKPLKVFEVVGE